MSSPVNVGEILASKYQVERVLGVGGMGVVVSAKHLILGERVAIKFLLPQALAREDVVKRFLDEGRAANRLRGEHIGRVHDVGTLSSGAPYLVMEYLDGKDLGVVLREGGPLSVEVAVDYVIQACEALAEAHSTGIIHRDLKPSNLFLVKRLDGSPSIKLIDFGISKILTPSAEGAAGEMTATAVMMGSPLYMAPEQMASARDVDGRADIWSLGIILHTVLTGTPPFRAPSVMQVYELIVAGAPPIRKHRAEVPEGVEAAILKCLQKDRRQRYADVAELADALAAFGPPEARFTADRIKRILSVRSTRDSMVAPPVSDAPLPVVAVTPAQDGGSAPKPPAAVATTEPAEGISPPSVAASSVAAKGSDPAVPPGTASLSESAAIEGLGTDGPWDQKTHPPSRRTRPAALIAAAAAVLIGGPVGYFALRANHAPTGKPSADASAAVRQASLTPPPASSDPAQPTVAPGASVTPPSIASTEPTATAAATATPRAETTSAVHVRRPGGGASPGPHPTARPKSPDDLFGTQK